MPPVFSVVESAQALSTAQFPHPLNVVPLPPMIIVEKGESLDEFILRRHPDFFTAIQARAFIEPALVMSFGPTSAMLICAHMLFLLSSRMSAHTLATCRRACMSYPWWSAQATAHVHEE